MSDGFVRVGVGSRLIHDGMLLEVVEIDLGPFGTHVVLSRRDGVRGLVRMSFTELCEKARVVQIDDEDRPGAADQPASVILSSLSPKEHSEVEERAGHVREVLTGFKSGSSEFAAEGEPRDGYREGIPWMQRYKAKADELGVSKRTVQQWVSDYKSHGEAGLASRATSSDRKPRGDDRWRAIALEIMIEHTDQSKPSQKMIIERANYRAENSSEAVAIPSRATAYRVMEELEAVHPTFRLSAKRNRDIADRPKDQYGKLRPTRPGEFMLMDTNRLDVFALDPMTLRWVQAELTVAMDWYTRCITGIRVTPRSTKAVDAASVLYQALRPPAAPQSWPEGASWPPHGLPRSVHIGRATTEEKLPGTTSPAIAPESLVVDHGKIYVSKHLNSVCERLGISIQPARPYTGRDKGPVERFFLTLAEDLLQALPGYKGPDVHSRGVSPENEAFFYLDELEAIIREWVGVVYHNRPHAGLVEPGLPRLNLSPAMMFERGVAAAGYLEVPADRDLAYHFLGVEWRTIQHYGVEIGGRRYNGAALNPYRNMKSHHTGAAKGKWPFHHHPDDITKIYFQDPDSGTWHTLVWEHAPSATMPMSDEALKFARKLAASKYNYPDDRLAARDLFERWNVGLDRSLVERRMALRLSREDALLSDISPGDEVAQLPSVAKVFSHEPDSTDEGREDEVGVPDPPGGDDDEYEDLEDFYADALEDT